MALQSIDSGRIELTLAQLKEQVRARKVAKIVIEKRSGAIRGEFARVGQGQNEPKRFTSSMNPESGEALEQLLDEHKVDYTYVDPSPWREALGYLLPLALIALFFYFFIFRQLRSAGSGGILAFGKSRAVRITPDQSRTTFEDVAGIDEAREEVSELIEFLRNPEKFQRLGGRLPRGVLLVGHPGTGKTLLAKAIAGEANVPFFSISGSDFVEMFVGVGASRVRDLFDTAKQNAPCIVFLDEIDAVGRRRANDIPGSGIETAQTLNAILVEMDGFTSNDNVIVIAATNRPDVLDPALLRPGRFDRHIYVDLPDIRGREAILKVHCRKVRLAEDVDISVLARGTPTFSGADLANLVNEAALIAVMRGKEAVDMECFEEARDKVRFGKEKRSRRPTDEDRRATAYHEAGHAILMRHLPHVTPLHKVSIIPRGRALGATMQLPERDEYNLSRRRILGEIVVRLGGRVAEEMFLDDVTNGAMNDLEQTTALARSMVCEWGMSAEVGLVYLGQHDDSEFFVERRRLSESMAAAVDKEVRRILDEAYGEARRIIEEHRADVELLVKALLEFEVLNREEVELILQEKNCDALRSRRARTHVQRQNAAAEAETALLPNPEIAGGDAPLAPTS